MNTVCLIGNLTRDPEINAVRPGSDDAAVVCNLGVAVNGRRKQGDAWIDVPNFFNVTVWGRQAELAGEHLEKGRQVGIQGRLQWRSWEKDDGTKGQAVEIVAENIDYLAKPKGAGDPVDESVAAGADEIPY